MIPHATGTSHKILFLNTIAFTVCFAAWMLNGVLVTFLIDNKIFNWSTVEVGWLLGIPVLSGSLFRLPVGMLTDRFGGKWVFGILLFFCSIPMFFLSYTDSFQGFALLSFLFGIAGSSFAVGIAYTSAWYPPKLQGTALGIFGMGNAGAALTTLAAPALLSYFTNDSLDGWRNLPKLYAAMLFLTGAVFLIYTENKKSTRADFLEKNIFHSLKNARLWRFGLYYFLVFGCFVAFSQWLVPYFLNVYSFTLITAGIFASAFSLPSGIIRSLGGWLSDKFGARKIMYWVLGTSVFISLLLSMPKMEFFSPGKGIMAEDAGTVTFVSDSVIHVDNHQYFLIRKNDHNPEPASAIFPRKETWHEPVVIIGNEVKRKQVLARGTTCISFQANYLVFLILVLLIGISWGIGKAAVYKYIPDFFPEEVGTAGGLVGVIGGLGGFFCPILFGYLLEWTGLWSSSWMLMLLLSVICLIWMNIAVRKKGKQQ